MSLPTIEQICKDLIDEEIELDAAIELLQEHQQLREEV